MIGNVRHVRNVVLTGFMGTGKSTVGRLLAERLGYEFVDTDQLIVERYGPIPEIFATDGEAAFRAYEREVAGELAERQGLVIATGGRALPKSGSDGAAYPWLTALGHSIVTPVPALAPLVLDERGVAGSHLSRAFADLSGITLFARLDFCVDNRSVASVTESLLFTHFGLSGPAAASASLPARCSSPATERPLSRCPTRTATRSS